MYSLAQTLPTQVALQLLAKDQDFLLTLILLLGPTIPQTFPAREPLAYLCAIETQATYLHLLA